MELIRGGGRLAAFGLVFALGGLATGYLIASGRMGINPAEPTAGVFLVGAAVFIGIGLVLLFGRAGCTFDRHAGEVSTWWGALGFRKSRVRAITDFRQVTLDRRIDRSDDRIDTLYPVQLSGVGKPLRMVQPREYREARRYAETVAGFLGLDLADTTTGQTIIRTSDTLDQSLAERLRASGEALQWPALPQGSSVTYGVAGRDVTIELPGSSREAGIVVLPLLALLLVVGIMVIIMFPGVLGIRPLWLILGWVVAVGGVAAVMLTRRSGAAARGAREVERIIVNADRLRVEQQVLGRMEGWTLSADAVEEIVLPGPASNPWGLLLGHSPGLIVRADAETHTFATGLAEAERDWLHDVIRYVLSGAPPPRA